MCGICGVISTDKGSDITGVLERLTESLAHRGPDGSGYHFVRGRSAGLGHRRLSILDLATGAQPMPNEDRSIWITYNGEIYNHVDLRAELEDVGHCFQTKSDTEVIVHGFEQWGPDLFGRLNGIFAFGLYDGRPGYERLWLVRDPAGVKPLYLGRYRDTWWFASELAAARASQLVEDDLRAEAIEEFLVYRFIPSPGTPYRRAWKVPPSHWCALELRALPQEPRFERYAPTFAPSTVPQTTTEWSEALRTELRSAVRRQLMADVPVGSLLSGGVDSTVVTCIMREGLGDAPQTFSIGFVDEKRGGELVAARRAAQVLGVPLKEVAVTADQYLGAWRDQVVRLGEPIANAGMVLVGLLCQSVRATHKVVLSGQGADEPLGGYARHAAERWFPIARLASPLLDLLPERLAKSDHISRMRRAASVSERARRFVEILAVFGPEDAVALARQPTNADRLVAPVRRWLEDLPDGDSVNALLEVDAQLSLADDLLTVADHMAMASSVELRVPFLDLRLRALLERMPSRYKVSLLGERKWLYRQSVRDLIPVKLRRELLGWTARTGAKAGFTTPLEPWVERWVAHEGEGFLLGRDAHLPDYLCSDLLRGFLRDVQALRRPRGRHLMTLFVLESWLRGNETKTNRR